MQTEKPVYEEIEELLGEVEPPRVALDRGREPWGGQDRGRGSGAGRLSEGGRGRAFHRPGDGEPRGLDRRGPGAGPGAPGGERGEDRVPGTGDHGGR